MTEASTAELMTALGRAALYTLLSRALAFPTPGHRTELAEQVGPLAATVETGDEELDRLVREALASLDAPLAELRRAHSGVFTHIEPPDYPPYESAYDRADVFRQTTVMADVAGFYHAHGLRVGGAERERPDHIVTQLEFMAFMARKEAYALEHLGADEIAECRRTQVTFLRDHLGRWAPSFGRRIATFSGELTFQASGRLLERWIEAELEAWGVELESALDAPQPPPPPEDDGCGFDPSTCPVANATVTPLEIGRNP